MPLTSSERKRKYVEKLKEIGLYDDYKQKKAAKAKERREQLKKKLEKLPKAMRDKTLRASRAKNRKRVKEYRLRKKVNEVQISNETSEYHNLHVQNTGISEKPYKTASALWKAVAKVKQVLPSSHTKKIAVVKKLLQSFDVKDQLEIINEIMNKAEPTQAISPTIMYTVEKFYKAENMSNNYPETDDCIAILDPLTKCDNIKLE